MNVQNCRGCRDSLLAAAGARPAIIHKRGKSLREISAALTAAGHMNEAGKPFAATSIRNMVTRGKAAHGK